MAEDTNKKYPDDVMDYYRMNRIMRHRLRNLCAGVKMTVERIATTTAQTNPQIGTRCDIVINELDNLREFTDRMDLLFDTLPNSEPLSLFELVSSLRMAFAPKFPFCALDLCGEESTVRFRHGSWIYTALFELLLNGGEAAGENGKVCISWEAGEVFKFVISNNGESFPEAVPVNPPVPFTTEKSRHDGLGLSIVCRIFEHINAEWQLLPGGKGTNIEILIPDSEMMHE